MVSVQGRGRKSIWAGWGWGELGPPVLYFSAPEWENPSRILPTATGPLKNHIFYRMEGYSVYYREQCVPRRTMPSTSLRSQPGAALVSQWNYQFQCLISSKTHLSLPKFPLCGNSGLQLSADSKATRQLPIRNQESFLLNPQLQPGQVGILVP